MPYFLKQATENKVFDCRRGTKNIKVRVGSTCSNYGGKIIDAKNITKHPKYINLGERLDYDVAVIELMDKIPTEKTSAIKLANEEVATGVNVTIAGWGKVKVSYVCDVKADIIIKTCIFSFSGLKCTWVGYTSVCHSTDNR